MARFSRSTGSTWHRRRVLAWSIRSTCIVVPMAASIAAMTVTGHLLRRPHGALVIGWYLALFGASFLVLIAAQRTLRKLIPLAALLDMTLEFPDLAPSRLSMSRRAHSTRDLTALLVGAKDETTQHAAERVLTLLAALAKHDRATRGHAERVRAYTDLLAARMGLSSRERDRLRWASLLHDIGKLHVPASLLVKPAKPTAQEWVTLRRHPMEGARIAAALLPWLGEFGNVIEQHHERWDGGGYPHGLSGHGIGRGGRIVAVADTFEVITAPRPYKRPIKREAALEELVRCSGTQFDPEVVRAFLAVDNRKMLWAMGPTSWLAGLPLVGQAPAPIMSALSSQTMNLTTAAMVGAVSATTVTLAAPVLASASATNPSYAAYADAYGHRTATSGPTATGRATSSRAVAGPSQAGSLAGDQTPAGGASSPSAATTTRPKPSATPKPSTTPKPSSGPASPGVSPTASPKPVSSPTKDPKPSKDSSTPSPTTTSSTGSKDSAVPTSLPTIPSIPLPTQTPSTKDPASLATLSPSSSPTSSSGKGGGGQN